MNGVPVAKVNTLDEVLAEPLLRDTFICARDECSHLEVKLSPVAEVNSGDDLNFRSRLV